MKNNPAKTSNPNNHTERFYIAYGSNLNLTQMAHRCPTAEVVGQTTMKDWRLMFRGANGSAVATIERNPGYHVPVLVWKLRPQDEQALDRYEGWPYLYRKETLKIILNDRQISAMAYIMNEENHPYGTPSAGYLETIMTGYKSAGFDESILHQAADESMKGV